MRALSIELLERIGLAQAATSQHLNQMKRVGLVRSRRRASWQGR